jgi:uncharacterized protein (UPF0332 family)
VVLSACFASGSSRPVNCLWRKVTIYEDLMESRQSGDYDLHTKIEPETARQLLEKARQFVDEVEQWLRRNQWL